MRAIRTAAVVVALVLPGLARGADVQLSVGGAAEWDSNVRRSEAVETDDVVFRVSPSIHFVEDEGNATWDIFYTPAYQHSVRTDAIDNFQHYLTGRASYHFNEATELFFSDSFVLSDAINTITGLDETSGESLISAQDELVYRNEAKLGLRHDFTERLQGEASVAYELFESGIPSRSDNDTYAGNVNLSYMYSPRHSFGGGVSATQQEFDASDDGSLAASDSLFVNLYATWSWLIDETTKFNIALGPTFIDSDESSASGVGPVAAFPTAFDGMLGFDADSCPLLGPDRVLIGTSEGPGCGVGVPIDPSEQATVAGQPPVTPGYLGTPPMGGSDTAWTIFTQTSVTKRWRPNLVSTLAYTRRDSTASGVGGSAVIDNVSFFTAWKISDYWDASVRGDWSLRQSTVPRQQTFIVVQNAMVPGTAITGPIAMVTGLTSATIEEAVDTTRYSAAGRLTRYLTERLSVSARYTYVNQDSAQASAGRSSDFEDHLITLGVQYAFDRWTLW